LHALPHLNLKRTMTQNRDAGLIMKLHIILQFLVISLSIPAWSVINNMGYKTTQSKLQAKLSTRSRQCIVFFAPNLKISHQLENQVLKTTNNSQILSFTKKDEAYALFPGLGNLTVGGASHTSLGQIKIKRTSAVYDHVNDYNFASIIVQHVKTLSPKSYVNVEQSHLMGK
jgi:hypothetical protein